MSSYLKVIEGLGLVAGLNESNEEEIHMGGRMGETYDGDTRFSRFQFTLLEAYQEYIEREMNWTRRMKRTHPDFVPYLIEQYFWVQKDRDIAIAYAEGSDGEGFYCGTLEEFEAQEKENRRLELEQAAKAFAAHKKVKLSSMEFIAAIKEEIDNANREYDNYNSHERQMEEWMDHMYAGSSSYYHENVSYTNSKYRTALDDLWDILEWLQSECPLLWAKYEESQLESDDE